MALIKVYSKGEDLTNGNGIMVEANKISEIINQGFNVVIIRVIK